MIPKEQVERKYLDDSFHSAGSFNHDGIPSQSSKRNTATPGSDDERSPDALFH